MVTFIYTNGKDGTNLHVIMFNCIVESWILECSV